jgi:hypothetical protein
MARFTFYRYADGTVTRTDGTWHPQDADKMPRAEGEAAYRAQARAHLLTMLKPGQTVYTVLQHVSSSGMSRRISLCIAQEGEVVTLDAWAAAAMGDTVHEKGGIVASGCGMDMGFHLVYRLGRALWPDGTPNPHGTRNGEPDSDGGYALRHRWL